MAGALTTVKRQHRPALDLSRLPELLSRIDGYKGQPVTRLAVMLNLLVFIRSSELRYARWSEIDIDNAGSDSNLLIVFYVQIMPDDLVMQLHRF